MLKDQFQVLVCIAFIFFSLMLIQNKVEQYGIRHLSLSLTDIHCLNVDLPFEFLVKTPGYGFQVRITYLVEKQQIHDYFNMLFVT